VTTLLGRRKARHRLAMLTGPGQVVRLPHPGAVVAGVILVAAGTWFAGGPVAALAAATYAGLAARAAFRSFADRRAASARSRAVDAVGALAADLRAGLAVTAALAEARPALTPDAAGPEPAVTRARRLVDVASAVSERLGAPLADLLDRVDADLRAVERCRADTLAQTAGARATGLLLAGLPLAGIALGYGIGGDPVRVLLHTPVGAVCAVAALALQCAGLASTGRLCRGAVREPAPARPWVRHVAVATVAVCAGVLVPGWLALPAALAVFAALELVIRRWPGNTDRGSAVDLPVAADLLAAALRAGAPPGTAARVVGAALRGPGGDRPEPVGDRLCRVAEALRDGTPDAWGAMRDLPGGDRLARAAVRSAHSGAALSGALDRLAADLRADRVAAAQARARRVGVLAVLPLGLCFLPAFLLAGVVPVVIAVLGDAFR
jgi:Flp pilus assembly protein TadB